MQGASAFPGGEVLLAQIDGEAAAIEGEGNGALGLPSNEVGSWTGFMWNGAIDNAAEICIKGGAGS